PVSPRSPLRSPPPPPPRLVQVFFREKDGTGAPRVRRLSRVARLGGEYFFSHSSRLSSLGYERVGPALRFCLRFLAKIKAVPARTCSARDLGLDRGEETLNTKGAGLHGWLVARVDESEITGLAATKLWIDFLSSARVPPAPGCFSCCMA